MDFVVVGAWFEDFHEVAEAGDDGFADGEGVGYFVGWVQLGDGAYFIKNYKNKKKVKN